AATVIGSGVEAAATEAAERGAEHVLVADAPHLAMFSGDAVVIAAAQAAQAAEAAVVVVARGPDALELAPRLAARLGAGVVLGGMPGASRAIVDLGWAPPAEQVGLTGKITSPDLYIAAGISGASQHMMGCATARVLVAINTDANAQIFKYAHFGVVGDAVEVLKELAK